MTTPPYDDHPGELHDEGDIFPYDEDLVWDPPLAKDENVETNPYLELDEEYDTSEEEEHHLSTRADRKRRLHRFRD